MSQLNKLRLSGVAALVEKPREQDIHRRIANACLRLERRNVEARRQATMALFDQAVAECLDAPKRQSVSDYYRQLQWTAVKEGLGTDTIPSESTFRRRVNRERLWRFGPSSRQSPAMARTKLQAAILHAVFSVIEVMPDHTVRLRRER